MATLTKEQAEAVEALLANAGYLDDADEILADHAGEEFDGAVAFATALDQLIAMVNEHKDADDQLFPDSKTPMLDEVMSNFPE